MQTKRIFYRTIIYFYRTTGETVDPLIPLDTRYSAMYTLF